MFNLRRPDAAKLTLMHLLLAVYAVGSALAEGAGTASGEGDGF